MRLNFSFARGGALLTLLLWAGTAGAAPFTPEVGTDAMGPTTFDPTQLGCGMTDPDGSFTCVGTSMSIPMQGRDLDLWNITLHPDPYANATLGVVNTAGATQDFLLEVILPIAFDVAPPVPTPGSIGGSVTDPNVSDSATVGLVFNVLLEIAVDPLYAASIDDTTVRSRNASLPSTVTPAGSPDARGLRQRDREHRNPSPLQLDGGRLGLAQERLEPRPRAGERPARARRPAGAAGGWPEAPRPVAP
jgi:hypothetical protein